MNNLKGKKLLVLGGAFQHCKLVEAAHELGVTVIVTDYLPLEQAPAKQLADKYYMNNITDIDDIVEFCRNEGVDGVIATSLDACQRPYQQICEKLNVPCFGNAEQYRILTDKNVFKEYCKKNGVDVIPEYRMEDFSDKDTCMQTVNFPIFIKPCDSRGSRGQTICNTYEEALDGIKFAMSESTIGKIVIEKYMGQNNDFSMTIIVLNGKAYPFRTVDRFLGTMEDGLDKLAVGAAMPSVFTELYMTKVHDKVQKLIEDIGLVNAPVFMQGFVDGDTVRFYDPGLRFPGGEYERMFKAAMNKNVFYPLIEYALTGEVSEDAVSLNKDDIWLGGKVAAQVLPTLRAGRISSIEGMEKIKKHPRVVSAFERFAIGDEIVETHNVNQRFCEIDVVCDNNDEMKNAVDCIYNTLEILDENGESMIVSRYDTDLFLKRKKFFESGR
ncbi:MAG: hypothetical protein IJO83_00205 [Clostridia bacterium]|nr:hypothetical protein [Clostridia bacterium]